MISYQAKQRLKEIGIRKVLGAGGYNLISILSIKFIRLYLVSLVVAIPVSYWLGSEWLASYVIRIDLGPGVFIIAIVLCFVISMLVLLSQVITAAKINPVEILREE